MWSCTQFRYAFHHHLRSPQSRNRTITAITGRGKALHSATKATHSAIHAAASNRTQSPMELDEFSDLAKQYWIVSSRYAVMHCSCWTSNPSFIQPIVALIVNMLMNSIVIKLSQVAQSWISVVSITPITEGRSRHLWQWRNDFPMCLHH